MSSPQLYCGRYMERIDHNLPALYPFLLNSKALESSRFHLSYGVKLSENGYNAAKLRLILSM